MMERGGWEDIRRRIIGRFTDQRRLKGSKLRLYYSTGLIPLAQKAAFSLRTIISSTIMARRRPTIQEGLSTLVLDRHIRVGITRCVMTICLPISDSLQPMQSGLFIICNLDKDCLSDKMQRWSGSFPPSLGRMKQGIDLVRSVRGGREN